MIVSSPSFSTADYMDIHENVSSEVSLTVLGKMIVLVSPEPSTIRDMFLLNYVSATKVLAIDDSPTQYIIVLIETTFSLFSKPSSC